MIHIDSQHQYSGKFRMKWGRDIFYKNEDDLQFEN